MWRRSLIEREKLEWRRMASLMSLTYNINRGKNKKMSVSDFFPFDEEISDEELKTNEDVENLAAQVERLKGSIANHNNDGKQTE